MELAQKISIQTTGFLKIPKQKTLSETVKIIVLGMELTFC